MQHIREITFPGAGARAGRRCAVFGLASDADPESARLTLFEGAARRGLDVVAAEFGGPPLRPGERPPGLERVLALADAGLVEVLLVAELSHLGSSFPCVLAVVERLARREVALASLREGLGPASCADLLALESWRRQACSARTSDGLRAAKARGAAVGAAPYGMRWTPSGLVIVPHEIDTLRRAVELHAEIGKWAGVAYALLREGRTSRSGRPWQRNVLARATKNPRVREFLLRARDDR